MRQARAHVHVTVTLERCVGCNTVRGIAELTLRDNESNEVVACIDCGRERLLR
jgi:predicted  nucleic acid-binding Zn-ribbon protein